MLFGVGQLEGGRVWAWVIVWVALVHKPHTCTAKEDSGPPTHPTPSHEGLRASQHSAVKTRPHLLMGWSPGWRAWGTPTLIVNTGWEGDVMARWGKHVADQGHRAMA
jgi:hypothetical protein